MITKQTIGLALSVIMLAFVSTIFAFETPAMAQTQPTDAQSSGSTSTGSTTSDGTVLTDPVKGNDCGGVKTAIIKCDADNSGDLNKNGIWALLLIVINVMTAGVGVLAVGGIVYGSILYTTAEDKADQVNKAVDIIRNVIIGLVSFALMWALLNFIIPGGVFSA
jgi:hypothetical protein